MATLIRTAVFILSTLQAVRCIALDWVVYPLNIGDKIECSHTTAELVRMLGKDQVQSYTSETRGVTEFWYVKAEERKKIHISSIRGVSFLHFDGHCASLILIH